jgi:cytochrome c oxidase subunit IV
MRNTPLETDPLRQEPLEEGTLAHRPAQKIDGQSHPIGLYLKVWGLLFVLSVLSYSVDFFQLQSYLRWSLILIFMALKAGLIIAVFMHMQWERLALQCAILLPPLCILVLVGLMALEADYVFLTRIETFGP